MAASVGAAEEHKLLGRILVDNKVVTQEQLDQAIHKQQTTMACRKIGEILVRLGYISRAHVYEALAEQFCLVQVKDKDLDNIPPEIISKIESSIALLYGVIPLREDGEGLLVVATAHPEDNNLLDNLEHLLDRAVWIELATSNQIFRALNRYCNPGSDSLQIIGPIDILPWLALPPLTPDRGGVIIPEGGFDARFVHVFERLEKLEQQAADQAIEKEILEKLKIKVDKLEERLEEAERRLRYL